MFPIDGRRARFIAAAVGGPGRDVLDVGCATGELCGALAAAGLRPTGVDVNPWFVRAAAEAFPRLPFHAADMRALPFRGRFDGVACVGSTLLYATSNGALAATLRRFHRALRPRGRLVLDVLNAAALVARRPFLRRTVHRFPQLGLSATIQHAVDEAAQVLTEQVTWQVGRRRHRDPVSTLRLLFPQELVQFLDGAGFRDVKLLGDFRRDASRLRGRRMIAIARRA
jgi:SAM-dependent methyltransferase